MISRRPVKSVVVSAPNYWGRGSALRISPRLNGGTVNPPEMWCWNGLPIAPDLVAHRTRQIELDNSDCRGRLKVYEHLGCLRWRRLFGVHLEGTGWGPYYGRAAEVWDQLVGCCEERQTEVPLYMVPRTVYCPYPRLRRPGVPACLRIGPPLAKSRLTIDLEIDYPGLGKKQGSFSFDFGSADDELLDRVFQARTQGWPSKLYPLSLTAGLLGWPTHPKIWWPQEHGVAETLDNFLYHRLQDLLGALSLLCRDGLFIGHVESVCAGHWADLEAVKEAFPLLVPADWNVFRSAFLGGRPVFLNPDTLDRNGYHDRYDGFFQLASYTFCREVYSVRRRRGRGQSRQAGQ